MFLLSRQISIQGYINALELLQTFNVSIATACTGMFILDARHNPIDNKVVMFPVPG